MTRGERPKVLPAVLQLHASLPAMYSQERARLIDERVTKKREPTVVERKTLLQPGPYAGIKNWARYLARN